MSADPLIDDMLAGEYVLGVMEDAERVAFERQLAQDPALKAAVARWTSRFAELDGTAPRVPAPARLWGQIEQSIGTPRPRPVRTWPSLTERLWTSLGFWRTAGFAGAAASLAFAVALGSLAGRATPQPMVIAILQEGDATPGAIVEVFGDGRIVVVPLKGLVVPAGRTLQVWTLWDREQGPMSVGLIDRARRASFTVPSYPARNQQLYEITLEPEGGSPTGRPTGPVLMKGLATTPL
jgi:anti-sigma-K factor RskA